MNECGRQYTKEPCRVGTDAACVCDDDAGHQGEHECPACGRRWYP